MLNPKWICILNPCKFCLWREGKILQHLSTWAAEIIFSQAHSKGMWSNLVGMGSKGPAKSMSFLWMSSGLPGMGSRISGQRSWKKILNPKKKSSKVTEQQIVGGSRNDHSHPLQLRPWDATTIPSPGSCKSNPRDQVPNWAWYWCLPKVVLMLHNFRVVGLFWPTPKCFSHSEMLLFC